MAENDYISIAKIRSTIHVEKTGYNKYDNFRYYTLADIFKSVKPLLTEHKLFSTCSFERNDNMITISLSIVSGTSGLTLWESSMTSEIHIYKDSKGNSKGSPCQWVGTTNTYLTKYLWMSFLLLSDNEDDPDSQPSMIHVEDKKEEKKSNDIVVTDKEFDDIKRIFESCTESKDIKEIWNGLSPQYKTQEIKEFSINLYRELKQKGN